MTKLIFLLAAAAFVAAPIARADDKQPVANQSEKPVPKLTVEEFDAKRKAKDAIVLDVRTPEEFKAGHVPGAVNIDIGDKEFDKKVAALDKDKTYLVHCARGGRSAKAVERIRSTAKLEKLFDFSGGMTAWEKAGKPVEK
jgi:rhodanese-related sulfurtransferase